ncbi:MAG: ComEC/Rec2 family competence protein, partial [Clostridia bacterium]|nr:ComEC/Rec2 family competence protein [Clostridia bacterium]
ETSYASALQVGDRFTVTATPREFKKEASFDEELYRLSDGMMTVLVCSSPDDCRIIPDTPKGLSGWVYRWNALLSEELYQVIGRDNGGLPVAVLLGNRSYLSVQDQMHFRRAGVSHLLALSGLHVSILIGALELFLRFLRIPKLLRGVLMPVIAVGYLALTGFSASTMRAVLMLCVLYLGTLLFASYDSFTSLTTVLYLILAVTPYAVLDVGMWMSFLAAASIIIFSPLISAWVQKPTEEVGLKVLLRRRLRKLWGAVLVALVANGGILLLISLVYGEVSLGSVPATLLLSLPLTGVLILSALVLLFPSLGVLSWICSLLSGGMLGVAEAFSNVKNILLPVEDPITRGCILGLTVVLVLFAILRIKNSRWWMIPGAMAILSVVTSWFVSYAMYPGMQMTYVHQTDGCVCLFSERTVGVAVDLSSGEASDADALYRAAKQARCTELEDLVLTRYNASRTYFIAQVAERMRVVNLHMPTPQTREERDIALRIEQEAILHGIRVFYGFDQVNERVEIQQYLTDGQSNGMVLSVRAGEQTVTYANMSALDGRLRPQAEDLLKNSHVAVVLRRGMKQKGEPIYLALGVNTHRIIAETKAMEERVYFAAPYTDPVYGIENLRILLR